MHTRVESSPALSAANNREPPRSNTPPSKSQGRRKFGDYFKKELQKILHDHQVPMDASRIADTSPSQATRDGQTRAHSVLEGPPLQEALRLFNSLTEQEQGKRRGSTAGRLGQRHRKDGKPMSRNVDSKLPSMGAGIRQMNRTQHGAPFMAASTSKLQMSSPARSATTKALLDVGKAGSQAISKPMHPG